MIPEKRGKGGFSYHVSDEQLAAFQKLTDLEKLQWVDEARLFTLMTETPETRERRENLRRGLDILGNE